MFKLIDKWDILLTAAPLLSIIYTAKKYSKEAILEMKTIAFARRQWSNFHPQFTTELMPRLYDRPYSLTTHLIFNYNRDWKFHEHILGHQCTARGRKMTLVICTPILMVITNLLAALWESAVMSIRVVAVHRILACNKNQTLRDCLYIFFFPYQVSLLLVALI